MLKLLEVRVKIREVFDRLEMANLCSRGDLRNFLVQEFSFKISLNSSATLNYQTRESSIVQILNSDLLIIFPIYVDWRMSIRTTIVLISRFQVTNFDFELNLVCWSWLNLTPISFGSKKLSKIPQQEREHETHMKNMKIN